MSFGKLLVMLGVGLATLIGCSKSEPQPQPTQQTGSRWGQIIQKSKEMREQGAVAGPSQPTVPQANPAPTEVPAPAPQSAAPPVSEKKTLNGFKVGPYKGEVRTAYTAAEGLPDSDVYSVAAVGGADIYVGTGRGLVKRAEGKWSPIAGLSGTRVELLAAHGSEVLATAGGALYRVSSRGAQSLAQLPVETLDKLHSLVGAKSIYLATGAGLYEFADNQVTPVKALNDLLGEDKGVAQAAVSPEGEVAVAARAGLFLRDSKGVWQPHYPHDAKRSWAPRDVRGVAYDSKGRLWFASPQGVGSRDKEWTLYTGYEGLPYNDFTTAVAGEDGVVWFGTKLGAIRFDGKNWEYRQGLRWLPDDAVRAIAVTRNGDAWFATAKGASAIERKTTTLAEKAKFFEDEIDKYHRRTPYGYVLEVSVKKPGDKSEWENSDSDNDGLWTAMYGAGECFAYAATKNPQAKKRAQAAFEALRFLGTVTQGGDPPAKPGFVARSILPTSGPNPSEGGKERDERKQATDDAYWKVIDPRWPTSADGQWYWKSDTSSDELDGHYFLYALYYDLVAESEEEKDAVRTVVAGLTDHLVENNFCLVDWDGKPTRWAVYNPEALNHDSAWFAERGLNSLSILSYLRTAEHVTGDSKYRKAADRLIRDHAYAANVFVAKFQNGPGSGNQSDDEMAFMSFYNLLKYESDPKLRGMFGFAFFNYWQLEKFELCPPFNFIYAASCTGLSFTDPFMVMDLTPKGAWLEESVDSLMRYPIDRFNWKATNGHRIDIVPLPDFTRDDGAPGKGYRRNGYVLPIDERFVGHWNHDPWDLDQGGNGQELADGASFLLPYYMGLYHGFIVE
ncbi:MAG: hypothetical protein HY706_02120 [Candidatus Hydrogenedentes bacterium]|nr:hypothetical protein [Candidatus Hydrogenedentota bacterium]